MTSPTKANVRTIPAQAAAIQLLALQAIAQTQVQTSADEFTRYELVPVDTHSFRIYYDVSAANPGATRYNNPIRRGSKPEVHGVYDRLTGKPLD